MLYKHTFAPKGGGGRRLPGFVKPSEKAQNILSLSLSGEKENSDPSELDPSEYPDLDLFRYKKES